MKKHHEHHEAHHGMHHGGHHGHHGHHMGSHSGSHSGHGVYKNVVEMPEIPQEGHMESGYGCMSFKREADPIALGQAGGAGVKTDEGRIHSQFKDYHWD